MEEEFLEEISLTLSQPLEKQIEKVVDDGISRVQCDTSLKTQNGELLGLIVLHL